MSSVTNLIKAGTKKVKAFVSGVIDTAKYGYFKKLASDRDPVQSAEVVEYLYSEIISMLETDPGALITLEGSKGYFLYKRVDGSSYYWYEKIEDAAEFALFCATTLGFDAFKYTTSEYTDLMNRLKYEVELLVEPRVHVGEYSIMTESANSDDTFFTDVPHVARKFSCIPVIYNDLAYGIGITTKGKPYVARISEQPENYPTAIIECEVPSDVNCTKELLDRILRERFETAFQVAEISYSDKGDQNPVHDTVYHYLRAESKYRDLFLNSLADHLHVVRDEKVITPVMIMDIIKYQYSQFAIDMTRAQFSNEYLKILESYYDRTITAKELGEWLGCSANSVYKNYPRSKRPYWI